ncbi:hypothetical protein TWF696_003520 [Orbilia brochopaga]|uniref:BTB domain-containing protein n=1 Tax=Orbilia brochopaga TaxID=3140254 RepID=A0AAV9TZQ4_9PEZI
MGDHHHHGHRHRRHHSRHHSRSGQQAEHYDTNHHTHAVKLPAHNTTSHGDTGDSHADTILIVGRDRHRFRVSETLLLRVGYLRERIYDLKYGMPATAMCELEFPDLPSAGVEGVLNWLAGNAVTLYVSDGQHLVITHLNDLWTVAVSWKISGLKRDIVQTLTTGLRGNGGGGVDMALPELIRMLTGFYKTEGLTTDEQGMISDAVNLALQKFSPHIWWEGIRGDSRPAGAGLFYQRVAGLLFRNLRTVLCEDCTVEDLLDQHQCLSCGKVINVIRREG